MPSARRDRVVEDGVIGGKTLAAINAADPIAYYQTAVRIERGALPARGGGESGAGRESGGMDEKGGGVRSGC